MALNADDAFYRDDLHFRTVTSLLSLFRRPDNTHYASKVPAGSRSNFKRMLAVSFLLARSTEVVACIPKRSIEGITLFCMPARKAKRKDYSRHDILVAKNPAPDETPAASGCSVRLEDDAVIQFDGTVKYLVEKWGTQVPFQEHCRIVANLISKCATAATPSDSSPSPTSRDRAYVDLVHYTLFHGARKLERRLLSKKMPHDHWTVLKDLDVAAVKPRPIKEFLHLFDQAERESLLQAFEVLGMDEQHYETLFTVVKNGTEAITTPHDGQTLFMQYHRFVLEVLEKAEKPVRNLRNNYNKFCKPKTGTPPKAEAPANTESSSKTTSSPKWNIPSEEQLRHALNDVYVVLRPLAHMAWESPLFDWYVTAYLGRSIQTALAADSAVSDDEDHHHGGGDGLKPSADGAGGGGDGLKPSADGAGGGGDGLKPSADGAGSDVDEQDDDEDEEQGCLSPSDYIEAHTSISTQKHSKLAIAKEWVYWLRLVAAPMHYSFLLFAHSLSRNTPKLSFRTITYPPSSMDMKPWKEVVKTIYPDPDEHTVIIDDVIKTYGHPASSNIISDPNFSFKGVPHCEAVLACLHYLASSGESIDPSVVSQDVLDQLKKAAPLIAPSKRCCPVCAAIQHELSSGRPGKYPIYNKHVYIYGCALPPGLPGVVRERVIRKFEDLLREYLDDVKLRSLSHCSAESVALSPTERLHTFTFRETPMF